MKRYIFTVLLTFAGIIGISIFYLHVNRTVSAYEKLSIETVSGEESELDELTLTGLMYSSNISYSFSLTKDQMKLGSNYLSFDSYFAHSAAEVRMKELRQKYRSFMRGKDNSDSLYEDQSFLVYGNVLLEKETNNEILISMYDKEKEEKLEFSIPMSEDFERAINIIDIQLYDQEVILMLGNRETDKQEIWRVSVNVNQKRISNYSLVYSLDRGLDNEENYESYFYVDNTNLTKMKYMPLHIIEIMNNGGENVAESHQLFIVNVESGELREIKLPEDVLNNSAVYADGKHVYCLDRYTGELFRYNEGTDSFDSVLKHNALINKNDNTLVSFDITRNKIYALKGKWYSAEESADKIAELFIIDLQTKQEVYHGTIDYSELQISQFDFTAIYPKTFD